LIFILPKFVSKMAGTDKWQFSLASPRPAIQNKGAVTGILNLDIALRFAGLVYLPNIAQIAQYRTGVEPCVTEFHTQCNSDLFGQTLLMGLLGEQLIMSIFLACYGRWEDQMHLITTWQVLGAFMTIALRRSFYAQPYFLLGALALLYVQYFVGVGTELTQICQPRLPPFPPKSADTSKPRHGWLGKNLANRFRTRLARMLITAFIYLMGCAFSFFLLYAFFIADVDNLRGLWEDDSENYQILLWVGVSASVMSIVPLIIVEFGMIPGLFWDCFRMLHASKAYNTKVFEIAEIDDDLKENGQLRTQMDKHKALSLTIVIPCYMPNEEEILPEMLDFYEEQLKHYPGESKILIVWNSPNNHPQFEELMRERESKWPTKGGLVVKRCLYSTSKCDNLNMACDFIYTEIACLNDADTMLHWGTMVRGSIWIKDHGYDIAQSMNVHCKADCKGMPGEEGQETCHPYGVLITIGDGTKPQNMSSQNMRGHSPFNGRGGFWRTSALKKVGFDHHTVGEDHDAAYRGFAYYGFKGILDNNMLCQEQEPPDCKSLVSQRIRWETAALEMRRTFIWILMSPHYSTLEKFILIWSQLSQNCNMPCQSFPLQVATGMPIIIVKGFLSKFMFLPDPALTKEQLCEQVHCLYSFPWTLPVVGTQITVMLNSALLLFLGVGMFFCLVNLVDYCLRVKITRYRPRAMFLCYYACLKTWFVVPFFVYLQYWAIYDYCWGGAKFIATARSPPSVKKVADEEQAGLAAPLLK